VDEIIDTPTKAMEKNTDSVVIDTLQKTEVLIDEESLLENLFRFNSEQDLVDYYGQENVTRGFGYSLGGTTEFPVTVLFKNTDKEISVKWRFGDTTSATLAGIEFVTTTNTYWQTFEGVKVGKTLKELETLNDSTFWFYGFEWDFGGLAIFESGALAPLSTRMSLKLKATQGYSDSDYLQLVGDKKFNSKNLNAQKLNPIVEMIRLTRS
ncbi:MAG: hypothetical protein ACPGLV_18795, partial [Bacteroidia bacterium]